MEDEFEKKLTVEGGFPIIDFTKGRNGQTPDLDADANLWLDRGNELAQEYNLSGEYQDLFALYVLGGKHPRVAAETALRDLEIIDDDVFLIKTTDNTIVLDNQG